MPYLDQGEFYGEFGSFDVTITLPDNYAVAATGQLQDPKEKEWLLSRSRFNWEPITTKVKNKGGGYKIVRQEFPSSSSKNKSVRFRQDRIHDFAWFADKRYIVDHDTCRLPSGRIIDIYSYYTPAEKQFWQSSVSNAKDAVRTRSGWIGEYPYPTVSVVQGPESFGGGMEYPTITVISPTDDIVSLDRITGHEIGHNWFYGILGTNERLYPWMDEGLNAYYDDRYSKLKYPNGDSRIGNYGIFSADAEQRLFESLAALRKDQPIDTPSDSFSVLNYSLVAYRKTAAWLEYLEEQAGKGQDRRRHSAILSDLAIQAPPASRSSGKPGETHRCEHRQPASSPGSNRPSSGNTKNRHSRRLSVRPESLRALYSLPDQNPSQLWPRRWHQQLRPDHGRLIPHQL